MTDHLQQIKRQGGRSLYGVDLMRSEINRLRAVLEQVEAATDCGTAFAIMDQTGGRSDAEAAEQFYAAINAVVETLADTEAEA